MTFTYQSYINPVTNTFWKKLRDGYYLSNADIGKFRRLWTLSFILYHIDTQTCFSNFLHNICSALMRTYAYISVKIVKHKPIVSIDSIELIIADVELVIWKVLSSSVSFTLFWWLKFKPRTPRPQFTPKMIFAIFKSSSYFWQKSRKSFAGWIFLFSKDGEKLPEFTRFMVFMVFALNSQFQALLQIQPNL